MKYLISFIILMGCASPSEKLSQKAEQLEVFTTKPTGCRVVGKVKGVNQEGSKELALNHALNQAADKGASGLYVDQEVPNGQLMTVHATAYKCD